jgi:SAM-dependent methyltransferase
MSQLINREHVTWAYRMLLNREPESAAVVEQHVRVGHTLDSLRTDFMKSDEFKALMQRAVPAVRPAAKHVTVERVETPEVLAAMLAHVGEQWAELGADEPHWSVLTADRFRKTQIDQNIDAFRTSGVHEVKHIGSVLMRNGLQWPKTGVCLEYGCGVGRVTLALAAECGHVVGADISAAHLKLAQDEAAAQELGDKVAWLHVQGLPDLDKLPGVDLIYSRIVLQHNPPPVIELILLKLLRTLNPGGVAIFQLPTFIPGYSFRVQDYLGVLKAGAKQGMEMHMLPQCRVFELIAQTGCLPCDVFADESAGPVYTSHTFVVRAKT